MKYVFFWLCILMVILPSVAQKIDLGPKLGANFATLGDLSNFDDKIGFVGGVFLTIEFENFALQPELLYSQQGEEFNLSAFDLDYINLPVLLKFDLIGSLNLQFGPQLGYLVDDNIADSFVTNFEADTFDYAGVVGFGIKLPLNFIADARYIFDISSDFDTIALDNGFFTLSLGFRLF